MWHNCSGLVLIRHRCDKLFRPHGLPRLERLPHPYPMVCQDLSNCVTPMPHGLPRPQQNQVTCAPIVWHLCPMVCYTLNNCVTPVPHGLLRPERLLHLCPMVCQGLKDCMWLAKAWKIVLHVYPMVCQGLKDCVVHVPHGLPRPEWLCHTCAP